MELNKKAMLVTINISQWTGRKLDREVTEKATKDYDAAKDAGRFNKCLIAIEALKTIQKIANQARIYHYERTLPWGNDGSRLLPVAQYNEYSAKIRELKRDFEEAVQNFVGNYEAHIEDAKKKLGKMFRIEEYPPANVLAKKYGFDVYVSPVPIANDFRVELNASDLKNIRNEIAERAATLQQQAMNDLWNRLYKVISHMAEKLSSKDAIFRDSLVDNIEDLCNLLPSLNIANDKELDAMRKTVVDSLTALDAEELRSDEKARKSVAKKAKQLAKEVEDKMADYM